MCVGLLGIIGRPRQPRSMRGSCCFHVIMKKGVLSRNGTRSNVLPTDLIAMAKLKVWLTPGCPYVMKVLTFINAAKLQDQVEYIQDSPEQRKYLAEKAGKESAAMPAMELPDGGIIMFPEEVNQIM